MKPGTESRDRQFDTNMYHASVGHISVLEIIITRSVGISPTNTDARTGSEEVYTS